MDRMIDVDYEAHARYEMVSRLTCQGWRHGYTADVMAQRSNGFRKIRKLVRLDRLNNLKAAEATRLNTSIDAVGEERRQQALGSGGLADTTDDEDGFLLLLYLTPNSLCACKHDSYLVPLSNPASIRLEPKR